MLDGSQRAHREFQAHRPERFTKKGHFMDVWQIAATGFVMSMAHIVTSQNPFTSNVAPSRHFSSPLKFRALRLEPTFPLERSRSFRAATLPRQGLFSRIHGDSGAAPGGLMVTTQ